MAQAPPPPRWPDRREVTIIEASPPGGFWIRLVAYLIDGLIVAVIDGVVLGIFFLFVAGTSDFDNEEKLTPLIVVGVLLLALSFIVIYWLYEALMTSSRRGATVGKLALGLRIVRADGARLSFGRATARHFLKAMITPLVPLAIGYLMAAFTNRKRALHDFLADTLVIKSS